MAEVRPSAPLEPFLRQHPDAFAWELHRLAPGLPWVRVERPVRSAALWVAAGCVAVMVTAGVVLKLNEPAGGVLMGLACCGILPACVVACVAECLPPRRVHLGDLVTFRDLARAVAVQSPA